MWCVLLLRGIERGPWTALWRAARIGRVDAGVLCGKVDERWMAVTLRESGCVVPMCV